MKKILLLTLSLSLILGFSACGIRKADKSSAADELAESLAGRIMNKVMEEEGIELDVDANEWPDNDLTDLIPEPRKGEVKSYVSSKDQCVILMEWSKDEAKAYGEQVKNAGFDQDITEQSSASSAYIYAANNGKGAQISIHSTSGIIIANPK